MTTLTSRAALARRSYLALLHHPVYDKHRRVVATSITNLDIHDIARSTRTYGLAAYYIVHPVGAQRELVHRIINHWQQGPGQEQNDFRRLALQTVRVVASLEEAVSQITQEQGAAPLTVATSASPWGRPVSARALVRDPALQVRPLLLLFGTGWGLTEEVLDRAERALHPIWGPTDYNHLSVRTAAGIVLDRLFSAPEPGPSAWEAEPGEKTVWLAAGEQRP
ncbi:MAG: RNA methyltransferase [Myxococcales bacterium]|nr:RNA methyltransferase [Myxococcota bacterium]MDW8281663.1 RNA methyltransferase [Myxococcales bacterium]